MSILKSSQVSSTPSCRTFLPTFFFHFTGQMFLMDRFFDGAFLTFGLEVIAFAEQDQEDRLDPLIYVFPRMTKCTFHKFGTSGEVEKHDALCLLPLNIVNEKVFLVLFFWYVALFFVSCVFVVYRLATVVLPGVRQWLLASRVRGNGGDGDVAVRRVLAKCRVGDWFVLNQVRF